MAEICFFNKDVEFKLENKETTKSWINAIAVREGKEIIMLNYIFCSDSYLYDINVQYLGHQTYTDIITFPYEETEKIEGDIFISIDRVKENATKFSNSFSKELDRVMVHGILHLCGYGDKLPGEKKKMRKLEEKYIREK